MYLVAQHVASPSSPSEGLNAFFYSHGALVWQGLPPLGIPDREPGELIDSIIELPPPGNRVRGFLDIVAPDEVQWLEIHHASVAFLAQAQRESLPWNGLVGRCLFRANMDALLARAWRDEVARLYERARLIYGRVKN